MTVRLASLLPLAIALTGLSAGCDADPSLDFDADGVADGLDNCPDTENAEQFDADADGIGDACDVTLLMNADPTGTARADELSVWAVAIADIANFTDEPQPYSVWSTADGLIPVEPEGVVEPGEIRTIWVDADARGVAVGGWIDGVVGVDIDDDGDTVDAAAEVVAPPPPALCSSTVKRDNIKVTRGEGGADPALELDVDTTVYYGAGGSATVNYAGTIKSGASYTTDATMYATSVSAGSVVSHDWDVEAVEFDTWDADDHGSGSDNLSFTCSGSGTQTDSMSVNLGNAKISVKIKAVW